MSRRAKFTSIEEREQMQQETELLESIRAAKAEQKRLDKNERARERYAAKKAGKKLCTVKWLKTADMMPYTAPSVFDLVSTDLAAYCHAHPEPQLKVPRLMHTGGDAHTGNCVCLKCNKGLTWRPCCKLCNHQYFS